MGHRKFSRETIRRIAAEQKEQRRIALERERVIRMQRVAQAMR